MVKFSSEYVCPVCGYPGLNTPAWDEDDQAGSQEICPSCGIQFGYDDAAGGSRELRRKIHAEWRQRALSLAQLANLNDAALWQAARSTIPVEQRERLAALHNLKQQRPLTDEELVEEQDLLRLYQDTLLIRAQAAVVLKQRGYDVSDPEQFSPHSSSL
ncbi:MAG TPA: hypothetical protein VFZ25_12230 [Chloroflexota bacterium]|nr:hypothetical protein [Chloroflexota bacterium]